MKEDIIVKTILGKIIYTIILLMIFPVFVCYSTTINLNLTYAKFADLNGNNVKSLRFPFIEYLINDFTLTPLSTCPNTTISQEYQTVKFVNDSLLRLLTQSHWLEFRQDQDSAIGIWIPAMFDCNFEWVFYDNGSFEIYKLCDTAQPVLVGNGQWFFLNNQRRINIGGGIYDIIVLNSSILELYKRILAIGPGYSSSRNMRLYFKAIPNKKIK